MKAYDFRGGIATELAPIQMETNMVQVGTNWYYDERLRKRPGWANLSVDTTLHGGTLRGFCNAILNSTHYRIVALDDGSDVNFYYGDTGNYTAIDATFDWTTGTNVEMVAFPLGNGEDIVVAVNGVDKPAVIYYASGFQIMTLEEYDERELGTDQWFAGQWDDSADPALIDDTTDAQSDTANDFEISSGVNNDGFFVAGTMPFNKVVIRGCPDLGSTVVAEVRYYAGDNTWTALTVTAEPAWTGAEADKTLVFNLPFDSDGVIAWQRYGDMASQTSPTDILNLYVLRVRFTTADAAGSADYLEVSNTQYLSQLFLNTQPQAVEIHQNRLWLASENAFRFAPPNQVTGWSSIDIEGCPKGGNAILQMVSGPGALYVMKSGAVYIYEGTTTANFVLSSVPCLGAESKRGAAVISGILMYVARDGLRAFVSGRSVRVSRHVDFSSYTKTNAVATEWLGNAVIGFPTDGVMFWADPDTIRTDDMGDGRVSLWKWTGMNPSHMRVAAAGTDNGYLIVIDQTNKRLAYASANAYDTAFDTTLAPITCTLKTRELTDDEPGRRKTQRLLFVDISKSLAWRLTLHADGGQRTASQPIASGQGTGHFQFRTEIPYTMDGFDLAYELVNTTMVDAEFYGLTDEVERRVF